MINTPSRRYSPTLICEDPLYGRHQSRRSLLSRSTADNSPERTPGHADPHHTPSDGNDLAACTAHAPQPHPPPHRPPPTPLRVPLTVLGPRFATDIMRRTSLRSKKKGQKGRYSE